jgi:hypothetical protein
MVTYTNPLNTKLSPICHLLALLGSHHILHVSKIRVNPLSDENSIFCLHFSCHSRNTFRHCHVTAYGVQRRYQWWKRYILSTFLLSLEKHFQTLSRECVRCSEKVILCYTKSRQIEEFVVCLVNTLRMERVKEELRKFHKASE